MKWLREVQVAGVVIGAVAGVVLAQMGLPARVKALETWKAEIAEPALIFLVCSQNRVNEGKDPRDCSIVLQGVSEMLALPQSTRPYQP